MKQSIMVLEIIITGLAAGFMLAAPVGPVGVLCVRRTLTDGKIVGLISGLGAATADAIFGGLVGLGVTWVSSTLSNHINLLQFVGGAFLCFLGINTYLTKSAENTNTESFKNLISAFTTTLFLTLINPVTMIGFAAFFASFGLFSAGDSRFYACMLVGSVFVGSSLWWFGIIAAASLMRNRLEEHHLRWMNRFVGILIAAFGAVAMLDLMWSNKSIFDGMGY